MKNPKSRPGAELPVFEIVEEKNRKVRFVLNKAKNHQEPASSDEEKAVTRIRIKNFEDFDPSENEWDDDDEALFEWRRRGAVESPQSSGTEKSQ